MVEHTPTPWIIFTDNGEPYAIMPAGRGGDICTFRDQPSNADADFIVKAVNNHDALVKVLEEIEDLGENGATGAHLSNIAHEALTALSVRDR